MYEAKILEELRELRRRLAGLEDMVRRADDAYQV